MIVKTLRQEFKGQAAELRRLALDRLHDPEWRSVQLNRPEISMLIDKLESTGVAYEIVNQARRDLRLYNPWDSLSMWMDIDLGLVCFAPEVMVLFAREVIGLLERKYHNEA